MLSPLRLKENLTILYELTRMEKEISHIPFFFIVQFLTMKITLHFAVLFIIFLLLSVPFFDD